MSIVPTGSVAEVAEALAFREAWQVLVFEGAAFREDLSRRSDAPDGVRLEPGGDGSLLLDVAPGIALPGPVQVLEIGGGSTRLDVRISLGSGARAELLDVVAAPGAAETRVAWEARIGRGAELDHAGILLGDRIHAEVAFQGRLEADARLLSRRFLLEGEVSRSRVGIELVGPGADADLGGLVSVDGGRIAEIDASIRHAAPNTTSRQMFQALAADRSSASFVGVVKVDPGAKGANARQSSRNIILSPKASIDSRPQLEIREDDVKCSHGSTTGRLDENALRFLRSRGFSPEGATALLVRAFAGEQVERLPEGGFRALVESILDGRG